MVVIDQRGARLEHRSGAMIVRTAKQPPQSIPLQHIDQLVIAGAMQLDSALLTHLAEQGASVVIMPGRGHRRSAVLHGTGHGDAARRLNQYRLLQDDSMKCHWAKRFVVCKIAGHTRLLRRALRQRPDSRQPLTAAIAELCGAMANARVADNLASLRGIEGAASARYFHAYRLLFASSLQFCRRNRRPPRDPVNAALSLGYTLAHGEAVTRITRAGLDPMLGFLHDPAYNRESLACDLVELARPRIEQLVWRLFAEKQLRGDQFSTDGGASRMGKAARRTFFAAYERHAHMQRRWFERYARVIANVCTTQEQEQPNMPMTGVTHVP